jgi:hypothetical protein
MALRAYASHPICGEVSWAPGGRAISLRFALLSFALFP